MWAATIYHEHSKAYEYVKVEHPYFYEAMRMAVEESEARGWKERA